MNAGGARFRALPRLLVGNLAILVVLLIPVEIVWRIFFANDIRYSLDVMADVRTYYDVSSLYPTDQPRVLYTRDANGFRGVYNSVAVIQVLVVGGSTTDQQFLDDHQTFEHVLRQQFQTRKRHDVVIVNAGVNGQSTYGHLRNFVSWFPRFKDLKPDYIIFLVGVNDFYKDAGDVYDALDYRRSLKNFVRKSPLYHLYRTVNGMLQAHAAGLAYNYRRTGPARPAETTTTPLIGNRADYERMMARRLAEYRDRLLALAAKTRALGARPIFVTQRFMTYWPDDGGIAGLANVQYYDGVAYNGVDMYYMNKLLTRTTMAACAAASGFCIDLEAELSFSREEFYDPVHTTPGGARKIGLYLFDKINSLYP